MKTNIFLPPFAPFFPPSTREGVKDGTFDFLPRSDRTLSGGGGVPVTVTYSSDVLLDRIYGGRTTLSNPAKITLNSSTIHLRLRGTDATLTAGGGGVNPFEVSVDGGAYTTPNIVGGLLPLFSGLTDAYHTVDIRTWNGYFGGGSWVNTGDAALSVTGTNPQVAADPDYGPWYVIGTGTAGTESLFSGVDTRNLNGFVAPSVAVSQGCDSFRFRATVESGRPIWVRTFTGSIISIETDGVAGPDTPSATGFEWLLIGTGDGTEHEYTLVGSRDAVMDAVMVGGVTSAFNTADLVPRKYIFGLGDSTTDARSCAGQSSMASHVYKLARLLGANCANRGISGLTTAQIAARVDGFLHGNGSDDTGLPTAPDVSVVLTGFNDAGDGSATQAPYQSMLNELIAETTANIVSVVPYAGYGLSPIGAAEAAAVAACDDPARVFTATAVGLLTTVTVPTLPGPNEIQTCDGLHPTDAYGGPTIAATELSTVEDALA